MRVFMIFDLDVAEFGMQAAIWFQRVRSGHTAVHTDGPHDKGSWNLA